MKLNSPLLTKTAGLALSGLLRCWMGTLDFRATYYDISIDPSRPQCRRRGIYIFWHEYMPFLMYLRGHCDLAMLMSRHRDANLLSRLALHFGFDFVRGSTRRGGERALRDLMHKSRTHHLTITPDGPRGPRRELAAGCIYLASKLQMPLIAIGLGYDRPWRMNTWDRFAVPRPLSRARAVPSPRIWIPPNLDRAGIERHRLRVEQILLRLTAEAEAWAEAGTRKDNEQVVRPAARPLASAAQALSPGPHPADQHGSRPVPRRVRRAA
jgi:lysophospholipid acyltransferase (LPLAT)-like uncharacterized protein